MPAHRKPNDELCDGYIQVRLTRLGKSCLEELAARSGRSQAQIAREMLDPVLRAAVLTKNGRPPREEEASLDSLDELSEEDVNALLDTMDAQGAGL